MNNKIQAQVNDWKLYSSYMEVPQALISLYLGPLSGNNQGGFDGRGQRTASPMLTAIMSGGVGISGIELPTQLINSLEQANHSFN